jgi:hypothetical protein
MPKKLEIIKKLIGQNRSTRNTLPQTLTKEQVMFLRLSRQGMHRVPFPKMVEIWNKLGWGEISLSNIRRLYKMYIEHIPKNEIS